MTQKRIWEIKPTNEQLAMIQNMSVEEYFEFNKKVQDTVNINKNLRLRR